MDKETRNALVRAHHNNINRYCRLVATDLTDLSGTTFERGLSKRHI
jgi:hypothetical protein